ncbi:MAG: hypothetical protein JO041_03355, partial [Acidobacteria bacterium]|nr:hypothetical protein [Acidobacteriota bacterium]
MRAEAENAAAPQILITSWLQGAGGIETHLLNLAGVLVESGAHVWVAARVCKKNVPLEAAAPRLPVRFIKTPFDRNTRRLRLSTMWAMAAWPLHFRGRRFDAILTTESGAFTRFLRRFLKPGSRVVGMYAGEP